MDSVLTLYHGSQNIIQKPIYSEGNPYNDYGLGFYCTESLDVAKEWACTENKSGFANAYHLPMSGLSCLNLISEHYHILNWLAILLENRQFRVSNDLAREGKTYVLAHFLPDYRHFDVVIGYRADDSYFSFASDFLNNTISLEQLGNAMYLGKLGEQIVLKSPQAFDCIKFDKAIPAELSIYYPKKMERDTEARTVYRMYKKEHKASNAVYLIDILRQEWTNDDARIPRNVSR